MSTHWTLGVWIGAPVAGFLIFVLVALLFWGIHLGRTDGWRQYGDMWSTGKLITFWTPFALALVVIFTAIAFWPYHARYHQYRPVAGTVTQVESRLIEQTTKFVVTLEGDPQPYGCLDTRCSLLKVGDPVHLSCIAVWQYSAADGYDCRWVNVA